MPTFKVSSLKCVVACLLAVILSMSGFVVFLLIIIDDTTFRIIIGSIAGSIVALFLIIYIITICCRGHETDCLSDAEGGEHRDSKSCPSNEKLYDIVKRSGT